MNFRIDQRLPTFNEYSNIERINRYKGAKLKRDTQDEIAWWIIKARSEQQISPISGAFEISFYWHVARNNRSDPDNICSAKKFILDALQEQGIIENDSQKYVKGISDHFFYREERDWVEVEINAG